MTSKTRVKRLNIAFSITASIVAIMGLFPAGFSFPVRWDFFFIFCIIAIAAFLLKGIKRCPLRIKKDLLSLNEPNLPIH